MMKPAASEYAPYAQLYMDQVPDSGHIVEILQHQLQEMIDYVNQFDEAALTQPCAPGEWTIKEILLHVIDGERVLAYRALRFARGDQTDLAGYDHDAYVPASEANQRPLADLLAELQAVRQATVTLFAGLPAAAWLLQGTANGYPLSVRAAAYFIAGHERHHLASMRENYGESQK